ncbi:MAG: (2Fe-2S)-binding protein [Chloroflexi bacterium]|nr:(2Fe-2S)-binding protein [Chloroflexota bacterium]
MTAPSKATITLTVNQQAHRLEVEHPWTLLHVLRDLLDLTGTKRGCDRAECGACTVLLDGVPVYACQMLALQVGGRAVVTIEHLGDVQHLDPLQQAFLDNDGAQCGYCTPGFILSAKALLEQNPDPTELEIRRALSGNLCRCNAYGRIIESVKAAAQLLAEAQPRP